jgi:hypothetical protein
MAIGHYQLIRGGPRTKKTVIDKAFHVRVVAI